MWQLNFETITPLHISNGNELGYNFDYVETNGILNVFDIAKVSKKIAKLNLFDFTKDYSFEEFNDIIEANKEKFDDDIFKYSVECSNRALYQLRNDNAEGKNIVKEFINSNGKFYIPGSSVKGVLATILHQEEIGIKNNITQKFVIRDSDYIDSENFFVDRTYKGRPSIQLMCLKSFTKFSLMITKTGNLSLPTLKAKLKTYYKKQLEQSIKYISQYTDNSKPESGANIFKDLLKEYKRVQYEELEEGEYLINLGFGSGLYFKIFNNVQIPKFWNQKKREEQEPHTTFSFYDGEYIDHIGWCKLKIEEI